MYVLAEGTGSWDGTVVNPSNPQRRDTQQIGKCILAAGSRTDCISPAYLGKVYSFFLFPLDYGFPLRLEF